MPKRFNTLLRAGLVWLLLMTAESLLGAARRLLLSPDLELALRQVSVMVGVVVIFAITWALTPWMRIGSARPALVVGASWALLTFGFELWVGWITGASPSRMFADYDLSRGGLMPLGLLAMALTPWAAWRMQNRS